MHNTDSTHDDDERGFSRADQAALEAEADYHEGRAAELETGQRPPLEPAPGAQTFRDVAEMYLDKAGDAHTQAAQVYAALALGLEVAALRAEFAAFRAGFFDFFSADNAPEAEPAPEPAEPATRRRGGRRRTS